MRMRTAQAFFRWDPEDHTNSMYMVGTTMRIIALCLIGIFLSTGCSKIGKTAGKAQAKIERKVGSVERGYEEGYQEEKDKQ